MTKVPKSRIARHSDEMESRFSSPEVDRESCRGVDDNDCRE